MKNLVFKIIGLSTVFLLLFTTASCSDDDDVFADITVNEGPNGDIGGDFNGNGGSTTRTITWTNNLATADYNADITTGAQGTFQMIVADSNGTVVLNKSLVGANEPDSFSGVTSTGEPGEWTVTITIADFNGDGSYSLSAGD